MAVESRPLAPPLPLAYGWLERLMQSRNLLGFLFLLPAAVLLLLFLTYPLGLGIWLGLTNATLGESGKFIGIGNYLSLARDDVFWLSVYNTLLYTVAASTVKFGLGLWLALLLNEHIPFKAFVRAIVLLPFIVPTVLSAVAFWWIYDSQFSIISWTLVRMGLITHYIDFLGQPNAARASVIAANVWRGVPFVAISLLAGLQTIAPSLYEAATLDGATPWQRFRYVTLPLLTPIIAVVMTFSVLFTFTDFQLIYTLTRGGPINATHLMATLSFQRAHHGRASRRGRGDRGRDDPLPLGGDPLQLFRAAAPALAARREGLAMAAKVGALERGGMDYLVSLPRKWVTVYLPLAVFLFVLLFPFYWMAVTSFKTNEELYDYKTYTPFWPVHATLANFHKLLFETDYPLWLWNTVLVSVVATFLSLFSSVLAAYAIERLRFWGARYVGVSIFLAYLVPPSILFIPLAVMTFELGIFNSLWALILTYPTFLVPFCTWLLMGYFKSIPYELEECALIDGANRFQILWKIVLPLAVPGLISAGIFAFTLSWNEFIYALTFISDSESKTVSVGTITELVEGDVYHWGSLMAGALVGSLPVAILYSFFVEHYVSSMTGAVKE